MMRKGKSFIVFVIVAGLTMFVLSSSAWAGEPPTGGESIQGPTVWGVVVLDCTNDWASIRVKQVCDCNVKTQAWAISYTAACPADAEDPLYYRLTGISIEGCDSNPITGTPIITKVKNFKIESTGIVSFDAQIKFVAGTP